MPCNSSYLEPTSRERELQRTAKLYVWLLTQMDEVVPPSAVKAASDIYGAHTDFVSELCSKLKSLDESAYKRLVVDAMVRDRVARDLATWWEDHKVADRKREINESLRNA